MEIVTAAGGIDEVVVVTVVVETIVAVAVAPVPPTVTVEVAPSSPPKGASWSIVASGIVPLMGV
jgi:hypothetical protein